jgi:tetratricopeptide (TPR) repeat protein
MSSNEVISVLNDFLTRRARAATVRLRDPEFLSGSKGNTGIFTGFFISPYGHLLTAFHPLKQQLWDIERPCRFELDLEFDLTSQPQKGTASPTRVTADYTANAADFKADWVLLQLDYACDAYLPVAPADCQVGLCTSVRAYGFTEDQPVVPSLGAYEGQYARTFPERSQFRVSFVNRGVGQSGGPVIDLERRMVIGVVSGLYHREELLTADAAIVNQGTFAPLGLADDLSTFAHDWRGQAAEYLSSHVSEFRLLAADQSVPQLPNTFLRGRGVSAQLERELTVGGESVMIVHGARGSGKTSLVVEAVETLSQQGLADAVFWYDFDQPKNRNGEQLVPALALHLMKTQGAFEPLEQFSRGGSAGSTPDTVSALVSALQGGSRILVFENVHYPLRDEQTETLLLLNKLARAAAAGGLRVLFTSWDAPGSLLNFPEFSARGLAKDEVSAYFSIYGLELSSRALAYIAEYADDIVCLEMFVRSPEWRAAVEEGQALPKEPDALLSYWVTRYNKGHVPSTAPAILLALAVLEQPADLEMLQAVSAIENFHDALQRLRTSPPLVMTGEGAEGNVAGMYSAHLNVRRAILATADAAQVARTHERAADTWARRDDFTTAARHRMASGDPARALALIRDNRETIIAGGKAVDLKALATELLKRLRDAPDAHYALHLILASCSNIRGDYADARKQWSYALRNPPDELATAMLLNRRGDSCRLASDYLSAAKDYQHAEALLRRNPAVPARRELGRARLGLAKLSRLKGEYAQAREDYTAAYDAFEECFDNRGIIETSFGVGEVTRLLGDWTASHQAYSESLEGAREIGSAEREAYALWGLGEVLRLTEDYETAETMHRNGLELCVKVSDTRSEGWALLGLAETYRASAVLDRARAAYRQAIDRFTDTRSNTEIAHATLGWCEAERAGRQIHLDMYEAVESTYREKELRHCLVLCLVSKAAALRASGKSAEASGCIDEAKRIALQIGLGRELQVIRKMQVDAAATPALQLNFP